MRLRCGWNECCKGSGARRTSDPIWVEEVNSGLDKETNMMIRSLAHGQQWVNRFITIDRQ